jgi:hypothetical protein
MGEVRGEGDGLGNRCRRSFSFPLEKQAKLLMLGVWPRADPI